MNDENVDKVIKDFIGQQSDIKIDKYSAEGGNAEVYFGLHKIFNERVSLKFYYIDSNMISHEEPKILRSISHENILKIYDARLIGNKYAYILTPEIAGGDLQSFLNCQNLSTFQAIDIAKDILLGLSELHKEPNRIVHRDLKANNILITNELKAIIGDFGSARRIENNKTSTRSSRYTKFYRAPEAIIDSSHSFQSDIYQVGVILFQMLGGFFSLNYSDWFDKKELIKIAKIPIHRDRIDFEDALIDEKIVKGKLFNLDTLPCYVDKKLRAIVKSATNVCSSKRYASTTDFLNALYGYRHISKSWFAEGDSLPVAECGDKKYRITEFKNNFFAEKMQKDGNWRKIEKRKMTIEEAIATINKE